MWSYPLPRRTLNNFGQGKTLDYLRRKMNKQTNQPPPKTYWCLKAKGFSAAFEWDAISHFWKMPELGIHKRLLNGNSQHTKRRLGSSDKDY